MIERISCSEWASDALAVRWQPRTPRSRMTPRTRCATCPSRSCFLVFVFYVQLGQVQRDVMDDLPSTRDPLRGMHPRAAVPFNYRASPKQRTLKHNPVMGGSPGPFDGTRTISYYSYGRS